MTTTLNQLAQSIVKELNNKTIVAIDDRYNDNDGAYSVAIYLDNNNTELKSCNYSNGYSNLPHDAYKVNATEFERLLAKEIYLNDRINTPLDKLKPIEFIGATVILKGSRKAPNNVPVEVTNIFDSYYDYYRRFVGEQIEIIHPETKEKIKVAKSCIKSVTKITYDSSVIIYNGKNN